MEIDVSNKIRVKDGKSAPLMRWCKENLVVDNPDFHKKQQMGKWTGNTPQTICLYETLGNDVILPFGCLKDLWHMFGYSVAWNVKFGDLRRFNYDSHINLYEYQESAVKSVLEAKNGILVMPCGAGKGLPLDAKICTPTGWKRNGDLKIGDAIIGSDGNHTRVTGIFDKGKVDAYKITFSDGVETICDKDHLWTVQKQSQRAESKKWFVENTENIYKYYQNMKCRSQYLYIPIVEPVNYYCYSEIDLSMNPWLLGFLLGDGCFQKSMITMSTNEDDLREKVVDIIGKDYGACEWLSYKSKYDYRFCGGYVLHDIKSLGLKCKHSYEKFIPAEYIYNSVDVRLAVLQGLFDADGHISKGHTFEYCTTSKQLADNVVEIIESLGGTAKIKTKTPTYTYNGEKRTGRTAYRIFFKLYKFKPFTSAKHVAAYKERTNYTEAYRIIKKIEPCDPIISRCITVDAPDQLYVTEHYVVTHNTQTGLEVIARVGGRALWITHTEKLLKQSKERAQAVFGNVGVGTITAGKVDLGQGVTFATVQTLSRVNIAEYRDYWDVIIADECMPGNTLIDTPYGKKELKSLRKGDIITSFNRNTGQLENKPITHIFKNKAHNIVSVNLENGEKIICTDNHPIFTNTEQWVDAGRLKNDDYVLRLVRQGSRYRCNADYNKKQNKKKGLLLLLERMFCKRRSQKGCVDRRTQTESICNNEEYKQSVSRSVCGEDENRQSHEKARSSESCIKQAERDRTSSQNQMWKWDGINSSATDVNDCTCRNTEQCVCRISDTNKNAEGERISDLLQSGYCVTGISDSDRDRRKFTLCDRTSESGQEENRIFEWVGVESVTVQEQTSDGTFGGLCPDGYVYNIEVEDNNNYFANGILVHNCQHCCGSPTRITQFYKVITSLSARYKIGLTATPYRADGLERCMFALLGDIIHEVKKSDIEAFICPVKVVPIMTGWIPDYDEILMGDGTIDYMKLVQNMTHDEERYNFVMNEIISLEGSMIVLANRVEYLKKMCDDLKKCGRRCICLSGASQNKKARESRDKALKQLNDGELDCILATYQLAREGLDVPNLRYVAFVTPEKDRTTVIQSVGRVGRKAKGKEFGTVIDFVDAFGLHKRWFVKRKGYYKEIGAEVIG